MELAPILVDSLNKKWESAYTVEDIKEDKNLQNEIVSEFLGCLPALQTTKVYEGRWWDMYETVVEISPETYISFEHPKSTGDSTPHELGYEPRPLFDAITQVTKQVVTTTIYS